jgi:hypothetical protein
MQQFFQNTRESTLAKHVIISSKQRLIQATRVKFRIKIARLFSANIIRMEAVKRFLIMKKGTLQ